MQPSVRAEAQRRRDLDQRLGVLLARAVPAVLVVAWTVLLIVALARLPVS